MSSTESRPQERDFFTARRERTPVRSAIGLAVSLLLHLTVLVVAVMSVAAPGVLTPSQQPPDPKPAVTVVFIPPEPATGVTTSDVPLSNSSLDRNTFTVDEHVHIGDFDFNITKIRQRKEWLFPFLTTNLLFLDQVTAEAERAASRLINPYGSGDGASGAPPLSIDDTRFQQTIDRAWTRRERWRKFEEIAGLIAKHHPDEGRLPEIVHSYLDQNILQPFCEAETRDPRFWAMLENASEHSDFIEFVANFAKRHPSSKTTTELLFILDKLARGNREVLLMLLGTDPQKDLVTTSLSNPDGSELAVAIKQRYSTWLDQRKLATADAIADHYGAIRLRILSTIVATTPRGYRSGDAWFLIGEILFERGQLSEAFEAWDSIDPDPTDSYAVEYGRVLDAIRSPRGIETRSIIWTLEAVHGRWRRFSLARMKDFGYACDDF